jgi:hypothetical protein
MISLPTPKEYTMFQWIKDRFAQRPVVEQPPEPVVVMICDGPVDAALFQAQLQDAGIPSALIGADSASMFGMQSGLLADVRIVVPHEFADAAIALIADSIENDYRDDDDSEASPAIDDIDDSTDV